MANRRKPAPNLNREVANALGAATGTVLPKGEDLLGDPALQAELTQLKAADKKRQTSRKSRA